MLDRLGNLLDGVEGILRWISRGAAVLVGLLLAGAVVWVVYDLPYRTATMRPDTRICVTSTASTVPSLNHPSRLLWDGEMIHLPRSASRRIRYWIDRFGSDRYQDRLQRFFVRAHVWAPAMRPVLRKAEVPEEMLYLMLIESGGNPTAISSAGAVGPWQFMEPTAREMGLRVSSYYDARRDPDASTRAAARYLRELYEEFDSWWLAAAAYNAGPHRVRWGLRQAPGASYWELSRKKLIPPSTREYVPKLLAAVLIGREPTRWGFEPSLVRQDERSYDHLTVASGTRWEAVAEAAGISVGWLKRVNPQYPRDLIAAPGSARVRLPPGRSVRANKRLAQMSADRRLGVLRHTISPGETLGTIASRYGVSVERVMALNQSVDPRRLPVGRDLRIPAGE